MSCTREAALIDWVESVQSIGGLYLDKNGGWRKFQIDLGIALLNYGIGLDWDGTKVSPKPCWTRQSEFVPCDCKKCFFV